MEQKEFFNSMAYEWDTYCKHDTEKIKLILKLLGIKEGSKVLDVGTGTGVLVPYLFTYVGVNGKVTAIDAAEKMIEVAQSKYNFDNVSFICGDVLKEDLPKETFDYTICYSVFPHFQDKLEIIDTISKLLKSGGKLIICHSQSRDAINNMHKKASEVVAEDNLPDMETIKSYFQQVGIRTTHQIDNDEMFVIIGEK
ncbi:class I SAM-dependent methyltransferase [Clostridium magnum]|uniref:Demethylmenaquinone methyltransferase n=1 Tax=Clostridium magnum DSM 2767 TaxID=1121326 RepID=A0A161YMZ5_9CLOT|nr:class I SAM-dependent methyltransferase [Clostridium magnum]KZL92072.1 demethylmenaquinone methyltransferase [Clostridium magnum DSM 2767]SHH23622.1 demethylmenaquinone methyltransferase / 2-methoxy-6-polyprenyl-1,4-benzoquinol methylase [Clostridium magnum DSM 2767]